MEDFKSIVVKEGRHKWVVAHNPTSYEMIGIGAQGAVFKLSPERCVKIFARERYARREKKALKAAKDSPIVPQVYETGSNYILMEYIPGPSLEEYLSNKGIIPESITLQLLFMLKEMRRLKFKRIDAPLRHIIVGKHGQLKVIDHVNSYKTFRPRPIKLFDGLEKLGLFHMFMQQVKTIDDALYKQWLKVE